VRTLRDPTRPAAVLPPDQFILLSAPDPEIVRKSVLDLVYQAEVAEWIHAM
jgi:UV DNA damage repair endonuclease